MHAMWDPAYLIVMVIAAVIIGIAAITATVSLIRVLTGHSYAGGGLIGGALVILVAGIIAGVVAFPFSGQYHRYVPKTGVVTATGSRLLADGHGGSTQKFVVTINGQDYGCNDTRCATVKPGDDVTLMCERTWQWSGTAGYDCNWGRMNNVIALAAKR